MVKSCHFSQNEYTKNHSRLAPKPALNYTYMPTLFVLRKRCLYYPKCHHQRNKAAFCKTTPHLSIWLGLLTESAYYLTTFCRPKRKKVVPSALQIRIAIIMIIARRNISNIRTLYTNDFIQAYRTIHRIGLKT